MKAWHPHIKQRGFQASASNLAAYVGLRRQDLRQLQCRLANLGLSSLGRSEAHVIASLDAVEDAGAPAEKTAQLRALHW